VPNLTSLGNGEVGVGCQPKPMASRHMPFARRSGQAMAWSSIMGGNLPPHIQLGIDTSAESFGLATTAFGSYMKRN
jgi:hypothetical protein